MEPENGRLLYLLYLEPDSYCKQGKMSFKDKEGEGEGSFSSFVVL